MGYTMQLKNGTELQGGRYRIEKILGRGGFGITYLAEQTGLGRKVAIKEFFMKEFCNRNAETSQVSVGSKGSSELVERFREKFLKEARRIASLEHKNIVPVIDVFEENGTAYYVMKYMGGGSLSDKVAAGALPESDALRYIRQIASALDFVHGKLMMHLDVKPANVLLSDDDEAVLIDFGLAKQYDDAGTQTSTTPVGISHGYAPMEQYRRGGVGTFSPATDIYSLGATLYKLVTGNTPPEANDVANDGLPELPQHLSSNVRAAIEAAMQFRLKDRPQSIGEFLEIVESGEWKDESGKWRDDIVQGTNEGDSEVTFAFREKPSTSPIERSTEETHLAGAVISNDSEKSQFSGSCHPECSEPSVDARRGQSQGSYKHANREILPPSGRQNDNSGKWRDERNGLGGSSKKKWAIIIAVLVIGAAAALFGTMSGGGSDDTAAERERLAAIAEEQRIEAERLAAEQQRLEQERLAQEAAEQQRLERERKAKEEAERKAAAEAAEKNRLEQERLAQEAAEQQRLERERKAKEEAERKAAAEAAEKKRIEQERLAAERKAAELKRKEEERKRQEAAQTRGTINGHDYVDLGLSVKWATCNVGASTPGDYGNYYAWGETTTKSIYTKENSATYGKQMSNIAGNPTYDAARKKWGSPWRLPTNAEFRELIDNCTWEWTTRNGHNGYKVTSKKNGNSIFLPATGWRVGTESNNQGSDGFYWSATPYESPTDYAYNLRFYEGYRDTPWSGRYFGFSVRPVSK